MAALSYMYEKSSVGKKPQPGNLMTSASPSQIPSVSTGCTLPVPAGLARPEPSLWQPA